jgi:hypothetical protein
MLDHRIERRNHKDGKQPPEHGASDPRIAGECDIQMIKHKGSLAHDQRPRQMTQRCANSVAIRAHHFRHHRQWNDVQRNVPRPKQRKRIGPFLSHSFVRGRVKREDGRKRDEHKPHVGLCERLQRLALEPFCDRKTSHGKSGVLHLVHRRTNESYSCQRVVGVARRRSHWVRARRDEAHVASSSGRSSKCDRHQHGRAMETHLDARRPRLDPREKSMEKRTGTFDSVRSGGSCISLSATPSVGLRVVTTCRFMECSRRR